jgi:adenylyltransferase/sulfurtransferase
MELLVMPETASMIPTDADAFKAFNYKWFCNLHSNFELRHDDFELIMNEKDIQIVDVREQGEESVIDDFKHIHIPLSHLKEQIPDIDAQTIVLFCQSGKRSSNAAEILSKHYGKSRKIYSLKDGIAGWQKNK